MSLDDFLSEAMEIVKKNVPPHVVISNIDFEGPLVVIYTRNIDEFTKNNGIIKRIAQSIKKRVAIRPDPAGLADPKISEEMIRRIIPAEAEIVDIFFEPETGEVTIEVKFPGAAIGKKGSTLNDLKRQTGWAAKIVRAPPIPSKTVSEIRAYLRSVQDERKVWLRKIGRKIARDVPQGEMWVRVTALGGYREVGRSCTLISTPNSKVLVDIGIDNSVSEGGVPYLNVPEVQPIDSIDAIVITHAHLDHSGLLPVLYKYGYDGPVYCTAPTRDVMSLLLLDMLKVSFGEGKKAPFDSSHIREVVKHCIPLRYNETTDISPDIKLTLQNAGHILGSSTAHFHIGDGIHNLLITGDIKYEKTWLFNPAHEHYPRLNTVIMESTYGGVKDIQPSRKDALIQLRDIIKRTLDSKGHVLIPVFAIGRSQEVMIVIEQLVRNKEIESVPVYLDGLIYEATAIHTAYPEYLNSTLRNIIFQSGDNPFLSKIFQRVDHREKREAIMGNPEPCIVLATSGMLSGGPVMEYLKAWAEEENSTLVFVGYQAEGTIGRRIQKGWKDITYTEKGHPVTITLKMNVATCDSFSGHSDRKQLITYLQKISPRPSRVILCHGEETKTLELAAGIQKRTKYETAVMSNLETVRLK